MAVRGSSILCGAGALLLAAAPASAQSQPRAERAAASGAPGEARLALASPEPTLAEVMAAAAKVAAGTNEEDESRLSRARNAHWAPQLKAQAGRSESEAVRLGTQASAPLHWDQQGQVDTWQLSATWDLSQLIFSRDENQLALSRVHLSKRRLEVSQQAADLYLERLKLLRWLEAAGAKELSTTLQLLRCTAALEALTGGLFRDALERAQALALPTARPPPAASDVARSSSGQSAGATQGLRNGPAPSQESR